MPQQKRRLDVLLVERGLAPTRSKAQALIMAGQVWVDCKVVDKAGTKFALDVQIEVQEQPRYVSRGGEKLAAALSGFRLGVSERVAADVGASTGGFTDCLLQHGVRRVYAIDVGYGQLAYTLRIDPRVIVMERTNARYLHSLPERIDLVVVDASFISLRLLLPAIQSWLAPQADIIALIKPQFEAGKSEVSKGGVVRDSAIHARVIHEVADHALASGFEIAGLMRSPIRGAKEGNVEFLIWLRQGGQKGTAIGLDNLINSVVENE